MEFNTNSRIETDNETDEGSPGPAIQALPGAWPQSYGGRGSKTQRPPKLLRRHIVPAELSTPDLRRGEARLDPDFIASIGGHSRAVPEGTLGVSIATIPPGSTIGILGGGQLGRMLAIAAARLGYRCHIFCPEADSPAFQVADAYTVAEYNDQAALDAFARAVDVITLEFENIPAASLKSIEARLPLRPSPEILHIVQHRLREKDFLRGIGVATTDYRRVENPADLARAIAALGRSTILKSAMFGYDGKYQVVIGSDTSLCAAWDAIGGDLGILEARVDFAQEISVILARGIDGAIACYDPVENRHVRQILDTTIAPALLPLALVDEAKAISRHIADELELIGLLAVEFFVTKDGRLLVNELASRPHNSGHWTIDACATSQFEQLVRAVCGLPLGTTARHSDARMKNLIGDEVELWHKFLEEPGARLHIYGKADVRPNRKMGHVTWLSLHK